MVPVLGGEVEEGEQRFPILRQAGDRLVVLGAVFVGEHVDRRLGRRAGRRAVNRAKVGLHIDLNREGDLVQHVGGLVNPTALVPGAREDLFDRLPEAERAVAKRAVRRNLDPPLLDREEELTRIVSSTSTSPRSRTLARRTSTGPTPVWIVRCGP